MVDKNWTAEEASAATEAALKTDPSLSKNDPSLPVFQWAALQELDWLEEAYKEDPFYLMQAICVCAQVGLPLPDWAAIAYLNDGYYKVVRGESGSWDEVFGRPYPKGTHLNSVKKARALKFSVFSEVLRIKHEQPGRAIDDYLFEEIGEKFSIGKTTASKYYYSVKDLFDSSLKDE